jgi:hypothetical protein
MIGYWKSPNETMSSKKPVTCPKCKNEFVPVKIKKPRELSEYNKYFMAKMKLPEVKAMEHKDRMSYIGSIWRKEKSTKEAGTKRDTPPVLPGPDNAADQAAARKATKEAARAALHAKKKQKTAA